MTSAKKRAKHSAIAKRKTPKKDRPPEPCPRCVKLAWDGQIRAETVMPLPVGADAPLAEDGSGPCCHDCQAADTINKTILGGRSKAIWGATQQGGQKHPLERGMPFYAVRVVVGNERQEQLRLPEGIRKHFGLVAKGLVRPSVGENALEDHQAWLASVGIHLTEEGRTETSRSSGRRR